jgi:hypothetical protein
MSQQTSPQDDQTLGDHDQLPQSIKTNDKVNELPEAERRIVWGLGEGNRPVLMEWQEDNTPGRRWVLETDDVTVGRDTPSDLIMTLDQISRRHLRVYRDGKHYFVADLGSRNGTWVNGERVVGAVRVKDGDEINVALVVKLIFLGEDAAPHDAP